MQDFKDDTDIVKVIKKRKATRTLIRCGIAFPLFAILSVFGLALSKPDSFLQILPCSGGFISVLNFVLSSKGETNQETENVLDDLSKDIAQAVGDPAWHVYRLDDITIIPKNIQIGENLEAINIIPIFKEGKFIIIQGNHSLEILAQYDEDGKTVVKILDEDEVMYEYTQFDEKTKRRMQYKNKLLSYILKD
ncbi:MAG: hypothetical protein K2L98_01600 [Bacilli bacterium]|nr:hypothetical protein [Bacilli bacterium]